MKSIRNEKYLGAQERFSLIDLEIPDDFNQNILIFIHGYMGYKDWGAWNLMQKYFVQKGFGFCKFNFSHNGGSCDNPIDFPDLEAFSQNTYSKEVFDLQQVLSFIEKQTKSFPIVHLIGHSRGGGIALLNANDERVYSVTTLAAISNIEKRFSDQEMLQEWKEKGVKYVMNQRTKQQLPHSYIQVEDFEQNRNLLSIQLACKKLNKPILILHGEQDISVSIDEAYEIATWTGKKVKVVKDTDHVFGATQPWKSDILPKKLEEVCQQIFSFLRDFKK